MGCKAKRSKECEGYKGPEMTAPTMEMMNKAIEKDVIVKCLEEIKLKNGKPAVSLYGDHTHLHINPSGKFIIGGPQGDAGLTGRKIIIDTYGGWGAHGGGAFSGKDPTKVDRSAAYVCRQMAKSVVKSGLAARCLVQLSYAIGVAKPLSLFVECYGSEKNGLTADDIANVLKIEFDCRPGAIALSLALREPKYQETAAGEITTQAKIDYEKVVRGVVQKIGFDTYVDDLSSVDSKGLSYKTCEVLVRINKQSPDIAGGVHVGKDEMDVGAGDQGIMFGYASDETADCMPLTHSMATRLGKKLTDVRKSGELWWLRPDGKTQVTIEYEQKPDGSVEPRKIHTVVISTQHAEPLKAVRSKEVAGYSGPEETAPSMEEMNKLIEEKVIRKTLEEIILKNGEPALTLYDTATTHLYIQPSGKFIIGGPQG